MKGDSRTLRIIGLVLVSALGVVFFAACEHDTDGAQVVTSSASSAVR